MEPDLSVELAGLSLRNPLLPGSGPPGESLAKLLALEQAGIGALVTKTASVEVPDVPKPKIAVDGELFLNVELWSEVPYAKWISEILPGLEARSVPLIGSLGYTPEDVETLVPLFDPLVDGFELSTHYISTSDDLLRDTVRRAKSLTTRPIFTKLSYHLAGLAHRAGLCEEGGADGITCINSIGPAMSIDVEKRASRLGARDRQAWLSGPAIKPLAMRAVYDVARAVDVPVIACGGATTGTDVIEFLLAGAAAVQSCTALIRRGPTLVGEMLHEIEAWCRAQGVARLSDVVGTVTPHHVRSGKRR